MEFKKILSTLINRFDEFGVRYGLIGGFSLVVLGIPRTTADIDFLIHKDDLEKLDKIMKMSGYRLVFRTENVSQYTGSSPKLGEVDFVHAFRKYSKRMLEDSRILHIEDNDIKVLRPEDIIALKLQAFINAPERRNRELADIESILEKFKKEIDWKQLEKYFQLFDLDNEFSNFKERYGNIDRAG